MTSVPPEHLASDAYGRCCEPIFILTTGELSLARMGSRITRLWIAQSVSELGTGLHLVAFRPSGHDDDFRSPVDRRAGAGLRRAWPCRSGRGSTDHTAAG